MSDAFPSCWLGFSSDGFPSFLILSSFWAAHTTIIAQLVIFRREVETQDPSGMHGGTLPLQISGQEKAATTTLASPGLVGRQNPSQKWKNREARSGSRPTPAPTRLGTYLLVDLPLKLDHFVLHANVELLQVLRRAGLDLQRLQLLPGLPAPVITLQDDGGTSDPSETGAGQPAAGVFLEDGGFVLCEDL